LIRAVLLDALGTLLELQPPAPALRRVLQERHGLEVTLEQAERAVAAEIGYYRKHIGEGRDAVSVDALRERCAAELRRGLAVGVGADGLTASEMTAALLAALVFRPYPEVAGTLDGLRARGLKLIVVSNWDASLGDTLVQLGLGSRFDAVLTSAQVGAAKPDPAIFEVALSAAGVGPEHAVHVGDSLTEDIAGARAAGITPMLVRRDGDDEPAPRDLHTLRRLSELPDLLGRAHLT
jgi:putative hydrolase of the HAD superfamily